jgi:hypothetical protein
MKISDFLKTKVGLVQFNSILIDKISNKTFLPTVDRQQFLNKLIEFFDNQEFKAQELENMMILTYFSFHSDLATSMTLLATRGMTAENVFDLSKINQNLGNEEWSTIPRTIALRLGSLQHTVVRYGLDTPFVTIAEDGIDIRYKDREVALKLLRTLQKLQNMTMENELRNGTETDPYCVFICRAALPVFLSEMKFPQERINELFNALSSGMDRKTNKENKMF